MFVVALLPVVLAIVSPVTASCARGLESIDPFQARAAGHVAIPPFSYGTTTGPLNWHNINSTYYLCGNGTTQSPILLNKTSTLAPEGSIKLHVPKAYNVEFENLGTTVEVVINGTLEAANKKWKLAQFHFHTPSEHRVDLAHYEAEMHLVFSAADGSGKITVLGFFVEVDSSASTPLLETVFSHLHSIQIPGTTTELPEVDFSEFEKEANKKKYYHYTGSLTAPPCTEGVLWYLATTPIQLKVETYNKLKGTTKTNNRYTQNSLGQTNILQIAAKNL
jgi:carbonic anhydrase